MRFSFSTVYTTIITSNLLFIVMACFLNSKNILYKTGYKFLGFIAALALFRLFIPFEFTFTKTLILPTWVSFFLTKIHYALFYIEEFKVTPWTFLLIIWLGGILYHLYHLLKEIRMLTQYIAINGEDVTEHPPYTSILKEMESVLNRKLPCRIIKLPAISSPMLYGLLSPLIILPAQTSYNEQELFYILRHEVSHFIHCDILLKYSLRLISILYWWNPACHILKKQVDLLLEMRTDESITPSADSTRDYLKCLIHIAEQALEVPASENVNVPESIHTLPISIKSENYTELTKRFKMLSQGSRHSKLFTRVVPACFMVLAASLYLCSHFFIWEASYNNPQHLEGTFTLSEENAYIIKNPDGTYDIYWNGMHIETVDSIYSYSKDIPIYESKEDIPNESSH